MSTGCSDLQSTFYTFLSAHVGKIKFKLTLLFVKDLPGIYDCWFKRLFPVQETDDINDILHTIDIDVVDDGSLVNVLFGNDQPFVMFGTRLDGNGQGTPYRLESAVQSQFTYNHILIKMLCFDIAVSCQNTDSQWQVVTAALLAYVSWSHIDCNIGYREFESVIEKCRSDTVVTLAHSLIGKTGERIKSTTGDTYFYCYCSCFKSVNCRTICFY